MKKIVLLILTVVFWTLDTATAQNPKVTSTFNYLQYYDRDGETDNLMSALEAINLASKHEQTKGKGKTWYYRGQVYQKIFDNEEISLNYPEALGEAWNSYKTAIELNDPKFRYDKEKSPWDDVWFCEDARKEGFKVYLDTGVRCKHYVKGMEWSKIKR